MSTFFMDSVFGRLAQLGGPHTGEPRVRREKTTEIQEGRSFEELRAQETTKKIERLVEQEFGKKIETDEGRPWPGAFAIVDERIVAVWLKMLEANGLRRFSDHITIDWFTKAVSLPKGKICVMKTPIGGEPFFRFPRNPRDMASLVFRVAIVDPQFLDEKGRPLYKELPKEYIEAVLNTLNPYVLYQLFGKDLPEMLKRAGAQAETFAQLLKFVAAKWMGKATPKDYETFKDFLELSWIHEIGHALVLHLPDEVAKDLPAADRQRLEAINYDQYLALINADQNLQTSVVFFKNLLKALQKTEGKPVSDETASMVIDMLMLEMFCDRFSMHLYENFLKMQVYDKFIKSHIGYPLSIDMLLALEETRKMDQANRTNLWAARPELSKLSAGEVAQLQQESLDAEKDHVYIRRFGDPVLSKAEWDFYTGNLNRLKHLDHENQIMRFPMQHANTSRFIRVSVSGLLRDQKEAGQGNGDPGQGGTN